MVPNCKTENKLNENFIKTSVNVVAIKIEDVPHRHLNRLWHMPDTMIGCH